MKQNISLWDKKSSQEFVSGVLTQLTTAEDPGSIVKALAPHDLLFTWRSADDEQRAELMHLADKEQVSLLVDLSCWPTDVPDVEALELLLTPSAQTDLMSTVEALGKIDHEMRTLLLKQEVVIHLMEDKNEPFDFPDTSEILTSPDGYYYIEFPDPDLVTESQRQFFKSLFMLPFVEYQREFEAVRHEFASELEETAYQFRRGRLADHGFALREDALGVLTGMTKEEVLALLKDTKGVMSAAPSEIKLPVLFNESLHGNEFLDTALEMMLDSDNENTQKRASNIGSELTAVVNRFMAAVGVDIGDFEAVGRSCRRVRNLIALGLTHCADAKVDEGAHLLTIIPPATFLQVGLGLTYRLRERARELKRDTRLATSSGLGLGLEPVHRWPLFALCQDVPMRYPAAQGENALSPYLPEPLDRELFAFENEAEIQLAEGLLDEIEQLSTILGKLGLKEHLPSEFTVSQFLLGCLAHAAFDRKLEFGPLPPEEAADFAARALEVDSDQFIQDCLTALEGLLPSGDASSTDPKSEEDPTRRGVLRLLLIGRQRLDQDEEPFRVLYTE